LTDGSMLRLTTSRYYTPTGRSIQKPYNDGVEKYQNDLLERYNHGEMQHADSIHFPDSLKYQTKILKRTVYGGGGIMPDIFIPIDTTRYTDYHRKIVAQGIVNKVVVQFNDKNRDKLKKKYKDFEKFYRDFTIDADILDQIRVMAEKEGIVYDEEQFRKSEDLIRLQLKAIIARDMWSVNEYYRIMDAENESLQRAIRILNTEGEYEKILQ
jgi:carboxyl-terminal processing protease